MKNIQLDNIRNVRDLGGISTEDGHKVVSGLLFRGSALVNPSEHDCDLLINELGIRCVIDLRTGWEREAFPDADLPGVEMLHIPFYDWEKVGIEYTKPAKGTRAFGHDIACEPELYYESLINPSTVNQMKICVQTLFSRALAGQAVYQHCSGGKDRSGVLAVLSLWVLGARQEDILEDYLFTNVSRDKRYDEMFERFLRLAQGDEQRAHELVVEHRARPENLEVFYKTICAKYSSVENFIHEQLGFSDARIAEIRKICTCPSKT